MNGMADFYDQSIREAPDNNKRLEILNEAYQISRPLTTFQQQYSILNRNFSQTHSDTISRILKDYKNDYDSWNKELERGNIPPEKELLQNI